MADKFKLPDGTVIDFSSKEALEKSLKNVPPEARNQLRSQMERRAVKDRIQEHASRTGESVKDVAKRAFDAVSSGVGTATQATGQALSAGAEAAKQVAGPIVREGVELGKEAGTAAVDLGTKAATEVAKIPWTVATNPIDITRQVASSATLGLAPMAEAFLRSGVQQKSMDQILAEIRESNRAFLREHPIVGTAAGLATPLRAVPHVAWALPWSEINRLQRMKLWPSQKLQSRFTDKVEYAMPAFRMADALSPPLGSPAETIPTRQEAAKIALQDPVFELKGEAPEGEVAPVIATFSEDIGEKPTPLGILQGRSPSDVLKARRAATGQNIASGIRQLIQGALFDFGDEAEAGVRSLVEDRTYPQIVEDIRTQNQAFREQNPGAALALQILGGVGTGAGGTNLLLKGAPKLRGALPTLKYPLAGAGAGAAAAAGATDPDTITLPGSDRPFTPSGQMIEKMQEEMATASPERKVELQQEIDARQKALASGESQSRLGWPTLMGGAFGAGAGTVLPVAAKGVTYVTKEYVDGLLSQIHFRAPEKTAALKIKNALNRDELTPQQAIDKIEELGEGAVLGDVGPHTRGLTQKALEQAPADVRRAATTHLASRPLAKIHKNPAAALDMEKTVKLLPATAGDKFTESMTKLNQLADQTPEIDLQLGTELTSQLQKTTADMPALMQKMRDPVEVRNFLGSIGVYGDNVVNAIRKALPKDSGLPSQLEEALGIFKKYASDAGLDTILKSDPNAASFILAHRPVLERARGAKFDQEFVKELNKAVELSASGRGILAGSGNVRGVGEGGQGGIADTASSLFFLESVGGPKLLAGELARASADRLARIHPNARAAMARLLSEPGQARNVQDILNRIGGLNLRIGSNVAIGSQLGRAQAR